MSTYFQIGCKAESSAEFWLNQPATAALCRILGWGLLYDRPAYLVVRGMRKHAATEKVTLADALVAAKIAAEERAVKAKAEAKAEKVAAKAAKLARRAERQATFAAHSLDLLDISLALAKKQAEKAIAQVHSLEASFEATKAAEIAEAQAKAQLKALTKASLAVLKAEKKSGRIEEAYQTCWVVFSRSVRRAAVRTYRNVQTVVSMLRRLSQAAVFATVC